ncbi:P-loop containing nucleoside triphosphate hydrolase protein [Pelagophyceae sp. CCMP2097]|nr:P-loop containing nucleoside triphosphate hydrolase protein [Pelagophyceae sp. CCMP2097]
MADVEVPKVKLTAEEKAAKKERKAAKALKKEAAGRVTPSESTDDLSALSKKSKRKSPDGDAGAVVKKSKSADGDVATKVARLSAAAFCAQHSIAVDNVPMPEPMQQFHEAPFNEVCQKLLLSKYPAPTPTQAISWPLALQLADLISVAKTGSGKTLGFLLPAFHVIQQEDKQASSGGSFNPAPKAVVLAPTRELAMQISDEAEKFAPAFGCKTAVLYGGAPKWEQVKALRLLGRKGLVIATPGRLNDLLDQGKLVLAETRILVLDEADRMLDMGFEPQIRSILEKAPDASTRQTMLFTATWSKAVQKVAMSLVGNSNAAKIVFNDADSGKLVANKDISQTVEIVRDMREKKDRLMTLLQKLHGEGNPNAKKSIVFVATKRMCSELADDLWSQKFKVDSIHGDREQWERIQVIDQFKKSEVDILIATDVAARGIDITDVSDVINYDFPGGSHGIEDYIHRIGRTGRAGKTGAATSYVTRDDLSQHGRELLQILTDAEQPVSEEVSRIIGSMPNRGGKGGKGRNFGRGGGGKGKGSSYGRGKGGSSYGGGKGSRW